MLTRNDQWWWKEAEEEKAVENWEGESLNAPLLQVHSNDDASEVDILGHFGTFWDILGDLGTFWDILGQFGRPFDEFGAFRLFS